jgi:hypothetical protein
MMKCAENRPEESEVLGGVYCSFLTLKVPPFLVRRCVDIWTVFIT